MKVLIPTSGGWNSTYALLRALDETSHDIVAPHYRSDAFNSEQASDLTESHYTAVTDWLAANVRPFQTEIRQMGLVNELGETMVYGGPHGGDKPFHPGATELVPLLPGFTQIVDGSYLRSLYVEHTAAALAHDVDELWIALDNQNHGTSFLYFHIFLNGAPGVKLVAPTWVWDDPADEWTKPPDSFTVKRFSQYAYLPDALKALVQEGQGQTAFYNDVILPSGLPVDLWDEWVEFAGGYGDSRDLADAATYQPLDNFKLTIDPANYGRFLGQRPDNPRRKGIDRAAEVRRWNEIRKS